MHSGARNCSLRLLPSWIRSAGVPNCPIRSDEVFPMSWPRHGRLGRGRGRSGRWGRAAPAWSRRPRARGSRRRLDRNACAGRCPERVRRARLPERTAKARRRAFPHSFGDFMPDRRLDVLAIGNAIVDVIADADDAFLAREGMHKGAMRLLDEGEATALYDAMGAGARAERRVGREHGGGDCGTGPARRLRRPACERPTWRDFPARHPEPGSRLRHAAQGRRRRHRRAA